MTLSDLWMLFQLWGRYLIKNGAAVPQGKDIANSKETYLSANMIV